MYRKILIVDNQADLVDQLAQDLRTAGYEVISAGDGSTGLAKALTESPSLIIADAALPVLSGLELCRQIKTVPSTRLLPVIILSAKNSDQDRIRFLEVGADDFVAKPFHSREMVLRVERSLGRNRPKLAVQGKLHAGVFEVDAMRHEFRVSNQPVELTVIEFKLVSLLMTHQGCVLDRTTLLDAVWGYSISSRTIDTHVTRLRGKLGNAAEWIETVHGVGYRMKQRVQNGNNGFPAGSLPTTADEEGKCLTIPSIRPGRRGVLRGLVTSAT